MKTRALTLALAAIAFLSTAAADAQSRYSYTVNGSNVMTNSAVLGGTNVLTYPAVVGTSGAIDGCATSTGFVEPCAPLFGEQTHWDNNMRNNDRGLLGLGGLFGSRDSRLGVNTYSAVIPNQCATTQAGALLCGQQRANEMFSLRLFGLGFGFGKVNPDADMRPSGQAL